jgi:hypothetical protein
MAARDGTNVLLVGGWRGALPAIWLPASSVRPVGIFHGCVIGMAVSGESILHKIALNRLLSQVVTDPA